MKALLIWGVAAATLGYVGCDPVADFQGAADSLVNPDETRLSTEPVQIASGRFSNVSVTGSSKDGGLVVALEHASEESRLRLARFVLPTTKSELDDVELESCEGAPTTGTLEPQWFEAGATVLAYFDPDGDGVATLRFVAPDCADRREPLDDVVLASWQPIAEEADGEFLIIGYVLETSARGILFVDARTLEVRVLSEGTLGYSVALTKLLLEEEGELVWRRSRTWDVIERFGRNVTEVVMKPSGSLGADPTVFFQDDFGLRGWSYEGVELIAEDGCEATLGGNMVAYFAPCQERALRVRALLGVEPPDVALPGVRGKVLDGSYSNSSFFVIVGDGEPGEPGTAIGVSFDRDLESPSFGEAVVEVWGENAVRDGNDCILDWSEAGGTYRERGASPRTLAGVTDTFYGAGRRFALSNYREGLVDIADIVNGTELTKTEPVLRAVAWDVEGYAPGDWGDAVFWNSWDDDYVNAYVIADVKEGAGEIRRLSRDEDGQLVIGEPLARGALAGSAAHVARPAGVAYLKAGGRGELWVHLLEAGLDQPIAERVSEYSSIEWPSPGLLYVVEGGRDAGIWFAKAR